LELASIALASMALAFKRFATIAPASEEIPSAGPGSTACACSDVGGAEGGSAASGGAGSQAEGTAYKVVSDRDSNAVAGGLINTIGDAIPAGAPGESGGGGGVGEPEQIFAAASSTMYGKTRSAW
jgi:hypothetical protein